LAGRHSVPNQWRIVLIRAHAAVGLAGERERQAFAELPPVPSATTEKLWSIACEGNNQTTSRR
jgi:predicted sugar kinase